MMRAEGLDDRGAERGWLGFCMHVPGMVAMCVEGYDLRRGLSGVHMVVVLVRVVMSVMVIVMMGVAVVVMIMHVIVSQPAIVRMIVMGMIVCMRLGSCCRQAVRRARE